ncbi:hypothetical protein HerbRD11066_17630 [Herbidospora sp. RD11066]
MITPDGRGIDSQRLPSKRSSSAGAVDPDTKVPPAPLAAQMSFAPVAATWAKESCPAFGGSGADRHVDAPPTEAAPASTAAITTDHTMCLHCSGKKQ